VAKVSAGGSVGLSVIGIVRAQAYGPTEAVALAGDLHRQSRD